MSLSDDLLAHAWELAVSALDEAVMHEVLRRRAVSDNYYALFHRINQDAVALLAPNVPQQTNYRIQRWLDHAELKRVCGRFLPTKLDQPLLGLIGDSAPPDLQFVARSVVVLQEARHNADYDLGYTLSFDDTLNLLDSATTAIAAWGRVLISAEANIFILSLLMWKNWEKERL